MSIIDHPNFYHWLILVSVLIMLTYAAYKIKNEPDQYDQTAKNLVFDSFTLKVPTWWGQTINEKSEIEFERLDTRYEWTANFQSVEKIELEPRDFLEQLINELSIKFDPGFDPELIQLNRIKVFRHEGMATENEIKRVYVDIAIVVSDSGKVLRAVSRSSILNGCVEGPYFERVLHNLRVN
jgi:hypothetical protein